MNSLQDFLAMETKRQQSCESTSSSSDLNSEGFLFGTLERTPFRVKGLFNDYPGIVYRHEIKGES